MSSDARDISTPAKWRMRSLAMTAVHTHREHVSLVDWLLDECGYLAVDVRDDFARSDYRERGHAHVRANAEAG